MDKLNILMCRVTQENMKNYQLFNANHNCLKCTFLHTLMVKTGGGLDFFWTVYIQ